MQLAKDKASLQKKLEATQVICNAHAATIESTESDVSNLETLLNQAFGASQVRSDSGKLNFDFIAKSLKSPAK